MVRADSLNPSRFRLIIPKVFAGVLALVLIFGIGAGIFGVLMGSKDTLQPPTNTSVPEEIFNALATKQYPISQPVQIPQRFQRREIMIIAASETDSKCEEVLQRYLGTNDPDVAYIDVYSSDQQCSYPRPDNAQLYTVGDYAGWISESPELSTLIELVVNQGVVRIETDFTRDEIEQVIQKFEPISRNGPQDTAIVDISQ